MLVAQVEQESQCNPIDEVLAYHGGDPRAAIENLLEDIRFLRGQLTMAIALASRGYTRGWSPANDRDVTPA